MPGGLLFEFGSIYKTTSGDAFVSVTFPKSFSNKVISITRAMEHTEEDTTGAHGYIKPNTITTTGFQIGVFASSSPYRHTYWMAIGQ